MKNPRMFLVTWICLTVLSVPSQGNAATFFSKLFARFSGANRAAEAFIGRYDDTAEKAQDPDRVYPMGQRMHISAFRPSDTHKGVFADAELAKNGFTLSGPYYNHIPSKKEPVSKYSDRDRVRPVDEPVYHARKHGLHSVVRMNLNHLHGKGGAFDKARLDGSIKRMMDYLKTYHPPSAPGPIFEYIDAWYITPEETANTKHANAGNYLQIADFFNTAIAAIKAEDPLNRPVFISEAMGKAYNRTHSTAIHASADLEIPQLYTAQVTQRKQGVNILETLKKVQYYFGKRPIILCLNGFSVPTGWSRETPHPIIPEYSADKDNYVRDIVYYFTYLPLTWDHRNDSQQLADKGYDFDIKGFSIYTAGGGSLPWEASGYRANGEAAELRARHFKALVRGMTTHNLDRAFMWGEVLTGTPANDLTLTYTSPKPAGLTDYVVESQTYSGRGWHKFDLVTWKNIRYRDARYVVVVCNEQMRKAVRNRDDAKKFKMAEGEDVRVTIGGFPKKGLVYTEIVSGETGVLKGGELEMLFTPSDLGNCRVRAYKIALAR